MVFHQPFPPTTILGGALFSITENDFSVFYGTDATVFLKKPGQGFMMARFNVVISITPMDRAYNGGHLMRIDFEHIRRMSRGFTV
jgi:hypothetical protein